MTEETAEASGEVLSSDGLPGAFLPRLYSTKGRMNRRTFVGIVLGAIGLSQVIAGGFLLVEAVAVGGVAAAMNQVTPAVDYPYFIAMTAYVAATIWALITAYIKRMHDLGRGGQWIVLLLVPIFGLALLPLFLLRGNREANAYGPVPRPEFRV